MKAKKEPVVHALKPGLGMIVNLCDGTERGHIIGDCGDDCCISHDHVTCPACLKKMKRKAVKS